MDAQLPATTPASQAGMLHGATSQVPAFRWYEKEPGGWSSPTAPGRRRVEERLSDGRGLLADGGVSVSNVFSGDAPDRLLTMSRVSSRGGRGPAAPTPFFANPFGFARALVLTVGEMVKELYQARRQRLRGSSRGAPAGSYVVLRGVTNVLLRDLNVALIAEHMMPARP